MILNIHGSYQNRGFDTMANEDKVLKAMKDAGKPVRPGDVAKMIEMDSKDVSKAIKELKGQGKIFSPKRCFYAPKED